MGHFLPLSSQIYRFSMNTVSVQPVLVVEKCWVLRLRKTTSPGP